MVIHFKCKQLLGNVDVGWTTRTASLQTKSALNTSLPAHINHTLPWRHQSAISGLNAFHGHYQILRSTMIGSADNHYFVFHASCPLPPFPKVQTATGMSPTFLPDLGQKSPETTTFLFVPSLFSVCAQLVAVSMQFSLSLNKKP